MLIMLIISKLFNIINYAMHLLYSREILNGSRYIILMLCATNAEFRQSKVQTQNTLLTIWTSLNCKNYHLINVNTYILY